MWNKNELPRLFFDFSGYRLSYCLLNQNELSQRLDESRKLDTLMMSVASFTEAIIINQGHGRINIFII